MKKILVIEDKKEEQEKARKAIEAKGCYCYVAEDLHDALLALGEEDEAKELGRDLGKISSSKINWDGVITDLHFPRITMGKDVLDARADANGMEIIIYCNQKNIPCVVCTDVHHHDSGWVKRAAKRLGIQVIDDKGQREEAWADAVDTLF